MFLNSMRSGVFSGFFLGILLLGGVGLILSDRGGFFRSGLHSTDVAEVDGHPIKSVEFDHILRQSLQGKNISVTTAYQAGIVNRLLQNEITQRLLRKAAADHDIAASDQVVANQLQKLLIPLAGPGGNPKEALTKVLESSGMSEQSLVESIRSDIATGLLKQTIGGIYIPTAMTKALYQWNMEERDVRYVTLDEKSIKVSAPDDATLARYYDTVKMNYSIPESRNVTVGILDPSLLVKKTGVSDDKIKAYYDAHQEDYTQAETRMLERAIFKTEKEAQAVAAAAKTSKNLKEAVQKTTGKTEGYNKADSFDAKSLPDQLSGPVFKAKTGDIVGPIQSPLGWHVIYVRSIEAAKTKSLDQVKDQIKTDLAKGDDSDAVYEITNQIEDRLSQGEKLESMADEYKIKIYAFDKLQSSDGLEKIDADKADKGKILKALFTTKENESSPLSEMSGGKLFTVHINSIASSKPKDLKDVKADVLARWTMTERRRKSLMEGLEVTTKIDDKKLTLEQLAKEKKLKILSGKIVRGSTPPAGLTKASVSQIMAADVHKSVALPAADSISIVLIDKVSLSAKQPSASELGDIEKGLTQDFQEERFDAFLSNVERNAKVKVNTDLLEQLYGQSQQTE